MAKKNKLNLPDLAKQLHTKVRKTDKGGEFIRYRMKHIKGLIYEDGTGGMTLKVPGLDCFTFEADVLKQIADLEKTINAYKALEPELKKVKKALAKAEYKLPVKPPKHGETNVHERSKRKS